MFGLKNKMNNEDIQALCAELKAMNINIDRLMTAQRQTHKEVEKIQCFMDDRVKEELHTVERKYITFLEGKLIQVDEEAGKLKSERELERYRMHTSFYSKI